MAIDPRAGQPALPSDLANIPQLMTAYYTRHPDVHNVAERVAFGTSGHRGSPLQTTFNEEHILAITQAICNYRHAHAVDGPLFLGIDTHAASTAAFASALEVLAANDVTVMIDEAGGYTPTPVISHAILCHNSGRSDHLADGIVVTPSHNPPEDGGFKYNPTSGGPADTTVTSWIAKEANALLEGRLRDIKRVPLARALVASTTQRHDYVSSYVNDLEQVIDFSALHGSGHTFGVDPLGGAGVAYWGRIAERYRLALTVLDTTVDPTFRFMTLDWDGRIRMDCSSQYAMRKVIATKDRFDVSWACDTDHDRHGIVAKSAGLLDPNAYLAVAMDYLFAHRPAWPARAGIGKTIVSSSMIDRVATRLQRPMLEVPVGFKWFVDGLFSGSLGFVGEESAGATMLRRDGTPWTTDKDGIVLGLLAAEMTAVTGRDPGEAYGALTKEFGEPHYQRIDAPATREEKSALAALTPTDITAKELAGDTIAAIVDAAPGNGAKIGGVKVSTAHGWFAVRPSGTEDVYKLYAESWRGQQHLEQIQADARAMVEKALKR